MTTTTTSQRPRPGTEPGPPRRPIRPEPAGAAATVHARAPSPQAHRGAGQARDDARWLARPTTQAMRRDHGVAGSGLPAPSGRGATTPCKAVRVGCGGYPMQGRRHATAFYSEGLHAPWGHPASTNPRMQRGGRTPCQAGAPPAAKPIMQPARSQWTRCGGNTPCNVRNPTQSPRGQHWHAKGQPTGRHKLGEGPYAPVPMAVGPIGDAVQLLGRKPEAEAHAPVPTGPPAATATVRAQPRRARRGRTPCTCTAGRRPHRRRSAAARRKPEAEAHAPVPTGPPTETATVRHRLVTPGEAGPHAPVPLAVSPTGDAVQPLGRKPEAAAHAPVPTGPPPRQQPCGTASSRQERQKPMHLFAGNTAPCANGGSDGNIPRRTCPRAPDPGMRRIAITRCCGTPCRCLAEPCGTRQSKQDSTQMQTRCTRMHADGPESGILVHGQDRPTAPGEPRRCGGRCPIRVHLPASACICVKACLLHRGPHPAARRPSRTALAKPALGLRPEGPHAPVPQVRQALTALAWLRASQQRPKPNAAAKRASPAAQPHAP